MKLCPSTPGAPWMLGGTISNTGTSVVIGNVGARTTITGFPPGTATGTVYTAPNGPSTTVGEAYTDFVSAYNFAAGETATQTVSGLTASQTFDGNTVYSLGTNVTSTAGITLTFDAQNNSSEAFVLQTSGALTIDGPITFDLVNGALANNIYWIVGGAATINPTGVPLTFETRRCSSRYRCRLLPSCTAAAIAATKDLVSSSPRYINSMKKAESESCLEFSTRDHMRPRG